VQARPPPSCHGVLGVYVCVQGAVEEAQCGRVGTNSRPCPWYSAVQESAACLFFWQQMPLRRGCFAKIQMQEVQEVLHRHASAKLQRKACAGTAESNRGPHSSLHKMPRGEEGWQGEWWREAVVLKVPALQVWPECKPMPSPTICSRPPLEPVQGGKCCLGQVFICWGRKVQ